METKVNIFNCPQCGAPLNVGIKECKYCGEEFAVTTNQPQSASNPVVQTIYVQQPVPPQSKLKPVKSKTVAGILGILFGGFGIHKFYLGKPGLGLLYLIFFWTYIPALIGFIEGISYLIMDEAKFVNKFGGYVV